MWKKLQMKTDLDLCPLTQMVYQEMKPWGNSQEGEQSNDMAAATEKRIEKMRYDALMLGAKITFKTSDYIDKTRHFKIGPLLADEIKKKLPKAKWKIGLNQAKAFYETKMKEKLNE